MAKTALKPRPYQLEAAKWALSKGRAVVCMPTGTGKTLVAALWAKELLDKGVARKVLFLEPTRFLVEQAARFLREKAGLDAAPLHGSLPGPAKRAAWRARIVVATPEIIVAEWDDFARQSFDALVVDECHHTTGQDPYRVVVERHYFRYRLGLTALVPRSRRREIEDLIGEIRCWSWDDPALSKYIPEWAAEVYEAPLNSVEEELYQALERLWEEKHGRERVVVGNAIRWYVRDGALALRETLEKKTASLLPRLLEPLTSLIYHERVRPAHKLGTLIRALRDHEGFEKAILFIDRVVVAEYVARRLGEYNPVLLLGRRRVDPGKALEEARREETRLIVSTSAGEEGVDLPEADLLVVWSNTASPLRFVQRLGRVLRAARAEKRQKHVVFIVTPETVDVDSLLDGLAGAEKAGVYIPVDPGIVAYLSALSKRRRVLDILYERPLPPDMAAQALGSPVERVIDALDWLSRRGYALYIYTALGKVYGPSDAVALFYKYYSDYLRPSMGVRATIRVELAGGKTRTYRDRGYTEALQALTGLVEKHGAVERTRITVFYAEKGVIRQKNRYYGFPLTAREHVRLVLDNAYCPEALRY